VKIGRIKRIKKENWKRLKHPTKEESQREKMGDWNRRGELETPTSKDFLTLRVRIRIDVRSDRVL